MEAIPATSCLPGAEPSTATAPEIRTASRTGETTPTFFAGIVFPRSLAACCVLLFAVNLLVRIALAAIFPLLGKELYFWEWAQFPAAGYVDYPPLVAWCIRGGCVLFGNWSPWAIRAIPLICGSLWPFLARSLALRLFKDVRVANWAFLLSLCLPYANAVGVVLLPDSLLLCFQLAFIERLATACREGHRRDWFLAGGALGLSLLCRLTALLALGASIGWLLTTPRGRRWLRRPEPHVALGVAFLICLPTLVWNARHDWANFNLPVWQEGRLEIRWAQPFEFLFEQLAHTSVFLWLPLVVALGYPLSRVGREWRDGIRFLRWQVFVPLAMLCVVSTVSETHPDSTLLVWVPAVLVLAALREAASQSFAARRLERWIAWSAGTLVFLAVASLPFLQGILNVDPAAFGVQAHKVAKAQQMLIGWKGLEQELRQRCAASGENPLQLCTDAPELASQLTFQRRGELVLNLAPLFEPDEWKGSAQRFYADYRVLASKPALVLATGEWTEYRLAEVFEHVEEVEPIVVRIAGQEVARYRLFRVEGAGFRL